MTLKRSAVPSSPEAQAFIRLPDTPEPKDTSTVRDFYGPCHNGAIAEYLGSQETTLVMGDRYLPPYPSATRNKRAIATPT